MPKFIPGRIHTARSPRVPKGSPLVLSALSTACRTPRGSRMYQTLRKDLYWSNMANDIFQTPWHCRSSIPVRRNLRQHASTHKTFPASGPLQFVAVDILGPLPKTADGYQYVLMITDRLSKGTCAITMRTKPTARVAQHLLPAWVYPYGTPMYLFTDNRRQLVAKLFEAVCGRLAVIKLVPTAYHPRTNWLVEGFRRTLATPLRHYV